MILRSLQRRRQLPIALLLIPIPVPVHVPNFFKSRYRYKSNPEISTIPITICSVADDSDPVSRSRCCCRSQSRCRYGTCWLTGALTSVPVHFQTCLQQSNWHDSHKTTHPTHRAHYCRRHTKTWLVHKKQRTHDFHHVFIFQIPYQTINIIVATLLTQLAITVIIPPCCPASLSSRNTA